MRVLIAGIDGYLGWPLANHLAQLGHTVSGIDNQSRRAWVEEMHSASAIPILSLGARIQLFRDTFGYNLNILRGDLRDFRSVSKWVRDFKPDAVVQLGECPSAAYSMIDVEHANFVQQNNISGTFSLLFALRDYAPEAHLVKLGTMGEYGTPEIPIPEGFFEVEYRGRAAELPFPRQAGSWYHWSKVHGSNNVMFACKIWGLKATDVMQGIVYGTRASNSQQPGAGFATRVDFDEAFGTIVNRFCCQAIADKPLTQHGSGRQRRGYIPLPDVMKCITLILANPPERGEYRVVNQFETIHSVEDIAVAVRDAAIDRGLACTIASEPNPRIEMDGHYYCPDRNTLVSLGYAPSCDLETVVAQMLDDLMPHRSRIRRYSRLLGPPEITWAPARSEAPIG